MINLETTFVNERGETVKIADKATTLKEVITTALLSPLEGDDKLNGQKKADLFNLWFDTIKDHDEADLSSEDKVLIKERVGRAYSQIIVGQVFRILK